MVTVRGKCSACGSPIELTVADTFATAALAAALCPGCTDQQFLDGGGAILQAGAAGAGEGTAPARKGDDHWRRGRGSGKCWPTCCFLSGPSCARGLGATGHFDQIDLTEGERRRGWELLPP